MTLKAHKTLDTCDCVHQVPRYQNHYSTSGTSKTITNCLFLGGEVKENIGLFFKAVGTLIGSGKRQKQELLAIPQVWVPIGQLSR